MVPRPPPDLQIPDGTTAVTVSAIDSTLWLSGIHSEYMYDPPIPGFGRVRCGCWSLFIEHPSGRKLVYDLGTRKDWWNLAPGCGIKKYMDLGVLEELRVEENVSDILREGGVNLDDIEGVIWSHFHFDHTGDVSTFPSATKLIVGAGTKEAFMPGYPADPEAHTLESDFANRDVIEINFSSTSLQIGGFRAYDYFNDGSLYILDSPGHAIGHVNALARTNVDPPEFVHLCGDSAHHCGEIRPSAYHPLPDSITPSPVPYLYTAACPSGLFQHFLRGDSKEKHILELKDPGQGTYKEQKYALIYDEGALRDTVREVEGFDACDNVFTILAHDWTLKGVIEEWPKSLNGWKEKGYRSETWWKFLGDFGRGEDFGKLPDA